MKEPEFWYDKTLAPPFFKGFFLWILSFLFRIGGIIKKLFIWTRDVNKPVICIGNLNVGGAGKTPVTISIAQFFKGQGKSVAIISRGYKGKLKGPLLVDPTIHNAQDVGDEPLLMSFKFPTWISANRYYGAKAAIEKGADIILLDDGLQHFTLKQDLKICVIDAKRGFGNKKVMPAGPLRESLSSGLKRTDALIVVGNNIVGRSPIEFNKPLLKTKVAINMDDWEALRGKPLVAFAGLAHPEKFFETLRIENFDVKHVISFPDHHSYSNEELETLQNTAKEYCAFLVTTQKDWVRLPKEIQEKIFQLRIKLEYQDSHQLRRLLEPYLKDKV